MQQTTHSASNSSRWLLVAAVFLVSAWCATLGTRKLLNPDEARYAEIPREMIATGDWLTPRLNDLKYFEKPPLQYWATAIAYKILGTNEFTARLWCGLTGLAGIFVAAWMGARLYGRDAGIVAAAVLASSLLYFVLGHLNTLDMGLAFFLQLAIAGFLLAQHSPAKSSAERNFMLLAWGATALAVLSKGIVAMALPVLTLFAYTAVEREYSAWRRLHIVPGLAVFLAIAAPWFVFVSLENPEFARFFFLHEHFQRFFTDIADRVEPWWYFIPLLLLGSLPWTSFAAVAVVNGWRRDRPAELPGFRSRRFLILWIMVTMLFFSVSHSKLPPYIVPLFPAIALLVGDYVGRSAPATVKRHLAGIIIFWFIAFAYVAFGPLPTRDDTPPELIAEVFRWATAGFALALLGAGCAWLLAKRARVRDAVICAGAGALLATSALLLDFKVLRRLRSGYDLSQLVAAVHDPAKPFYSIKAYDHSLSFYLGRAQTIVDYKGELIFGQQQEPAKALPDLATFLTAWQRDPSGSLAVMTPDAYRYLSEQGAPMIVVGSDVHLRAVKKP
jgi:4-amino-4-deoxy-L-arabinose transferase-like glycosyltransferase